MSYSHRKNRYSRALLTCHQARELSWLLENLQEKLAEFKAGLEDCYALLAPTEDPESSTLVISSSKSELVKGHVTRVGTRIVKGVSRKRYIFP